jgi:hypothetical protein
MLPGDRRTLKGTNFTGWQESCFSRFFVFTVASQNLTFFFQPVSAN